MQNMVQKLLLIAVILVLCIWQITPPGKNIKLGKDLRGGVSLIYHVNIPPDSDATSVLGQTINVLKDRVNPTGVLDISMEPMGNDRIEIVMPLPNDEVKQLQKTYREALEALLGDAEIPTMELESAVQQGRAVEQWGGTPGTDRSNLMEELQQAYDTLVSDRAALADARGSGVGDAELFPFEKAVADADIGYEDALDAVLRLSLPESRITRVLHLKTNQRPKTDPLTGEKVRNSLTGEIEMRPSAREDALSEVRAEYPHLQGQLDATVEAFDAYQAKRTGFDDPEDLMRLLQGAGVLEYHIAVTTTNAQDSGVGIDALRQQLTEGGPESVDSGQAAWFPLNDVSQWADNPASGAALRANPASYFQTSYNGLTAGEYEGEYYILLYTTDELSMTHKATGAKWSIVQTYKSNDQLGREAVGFRLDPAGGSLMGRLTGQNLKEPMAIVLDGQVFSAPTVQSQIMSSGVITGSFSRQELDYLFRVLDSGALEARLGEQPIAISTVGPSIGADNLHRGMESFLIAIIAVCVFMMIYYFFAGFVADVALLINGLMIFGAMSFIHGTFTLPGLAGIVLTIGMAVDANVLIYERIREELMDAGEDLRAAIREGYSKATSTIIDANVTNLIVCVVLGYTATTEVKGFAVTLGIGILATMFTTLFVTRQVYYLYTELFGIKKLTMLPIAMPAIHKILNPKLNWINMRKGFWVLSGLTVACSIVLVNQHGQDMFDTEFRGGVSITMKTRLAGDSPDAERVQLVQSGETGVEAQIHAYADERGVATSDEFVKSVMGELSRASVLTVGETRIDNQGRVTCDQFQIKVATPKGVEDDQDISHLVQESVEMVFGEQLEITPSLDFKGREGDTPHTEFTFPLDSSAKKGAQRDQLGTYINRPDVTTRIREYLDGVAVVVQDINPPVSLDDVRARIERMRQQPDFIDCIGRRVGVFGLDQAPVSPGTGGEEIDHFSTIAVCVYDDAINLKKMDAEQVDERVSAAEWKLVSMALGQPPSLEQVNSFSSSVARTLAANAIVAVVLTLLGILVYIWVRFGSLRYSVAAIVALIHDVTIALGLLAITGIIGGTVLGHTLMIEEFRIDLGVVAALLTIIGYSLNDTIVILDRIRENRGKLPLPTAAIVNQSINQTFSRTMLTSITTITAVFIMYAMGGTGIRPFTFCLLTGLIVGTYSSVAIAAPLVFTGKASNSGSEEVKEESLPVVG